jgi:hypothetical protein
MSEKSPYRQHTENTLIVREKQMIFKERRDTMEENHGNVSPFIGTESEKRGT